VQQLRLDKPIFFKTFTPVYLSKRLTSLLEAEYACYIKKTRRTFRYAYFVTTYPAGAGRIDGRFVHVTDIYSYHYLKWYYCRVLFLDLFQRFLFSDPKIR